VLTAVVANMSTVDHVTSVEIDLLAARSSQRTFEQNQLQDKATVIWSSGTENLPASKFDFIVSNPPFHQGIKTAYEPTERFFAEAHQWLKRGGKFVWVANDFLNYQQLLEANFTKISLLKHERGFKVLSAIRK
jgi:16S rRNA (guanine1207-N2)-methyltransferase